MASIRFSGGHVLFRNGGIWFGTGACCAPCPGTNPGGTTPGTLPASVPTCLKLRRSDFPLCGSCGTPGGTPVWDGRLSYNGTTGWLGVASVTPTLQRITATILFTPGVFTLTILCSDGSYLWTGTKTVGDTPCGNYQRTSGCDTTFLMTVR